MALELEIIPLLLLPMLSYRLLGEKIANPLSLSESLSLGLSVIGRCVADHTTVWIGSRSLPQ